MLGKIALFTFLFYCCDARKYDYACNDDLKHLSVGNIHLDDKNYAKFKKDVMATSKVFILGASDSSCDTCCFTEGMLSHIKMLFDVKKYTGRVSFLSQSIRSHLIIHFFLIRKGQEFKLLELI